MPQVALSRWAQKDLPRLYAFLAKWDVHIAEEAIDTILLAFDGLHMPGIGAPVPGRAGVRKLVIDFGDTGYTALYRYSKSTDTILVLAIKHQKELDYK